MKKSLLSFFTVTLLCLMTGKPVMAQELPAQKETLETIVKVNDYFMKKYADYTLPSFFTHCLLSMAEFVQAIYGREAYIMKD